MAGLAQETQEQKPTAEAEEQEPLTSEKAHIRQWQTRIKNAKTKWERDFKRMKDNMDFVSGLQSPGQNHIHDDRYTTNFTLRAINQKVATLYARNPRVVCRRRQRLDFSVWDGKIESLQQAVAAAQMAQMTGFPPPPQVLALFMDYMQGTQHRDMIKKVGNTLETLLQISLDIQTPVDFKTQAKQWVRRACICGVSYIRASLCRDYESGDMSHSETRSTKADRVKRAQQILEKLEKDKISEDDAEVETLKSFILSLGVQQVDSEAVQVQERIVFDFPPSTSIIPDEQCRNLVGFIGARYVAQEYVLPLEFINSYFETSIKAGGSGHATEFTAGGQPKVQSTAEPKGSPSVKPKVCLWEVFDLDTKTTFFLVDGHDDYVQAPEPLEPSTSSFWPVFALVFNNTEIEGDCKSSIYPPSDVDVLRSMQKEWNESRQERKKHRRASVPRYVYPEGSVSQETLDKIEDSQSQEFIPVKCAPDKEPAKLVMPLMVIPMNEALYNTQPLAEDMMLASGTQEANIGPAQPNVTATVGTIAEQSRMTVASSNVDDLDDCLTAVINCAGQMALREMSLEAVQRTVGRGTAWPEQDKSEYLNEIYIETEAASSGRPNKAIEIANWERLAPLIMQAATMPPQLQTTVQAVIRETVKRADDRLDPMDFFPPPGLAQLMAPPVQPGPPPTGPGGSPNPGSGNTPARAKGPRQPLQRPSTPAMSPVPLAGA